MFSALIMPVSTSLFCKLFNAVGELALELVLAVDMAIEGLFGSACESAGFASLQGKSVNLSFRGLRGILRGRLRGIRGRGLRGIRREILCCKC